MSRPGPSSLPLATLLIHAADAVAAVLRGRSLNEALAAVPAPARPGTQALAFEALRRLGLAQALRRSLVPRAPPPWVDALLLVTLTLATPDAQADAQAPHYEAHTLVSQAVEAAKRRAPAQARLVNAVLRRAQREDLAAAAIAADPVARWNHPQWWIDRLQRDWPQQWQALLLANNRRAPMTLRVNARQDSADHYLKRLAEAGIGASMPQDALARHAVQLDAPVPVPALPGFGDGAVSVQDLAAQWAAPLLLGPAFDGDTPLAPGSRVLDACAAPGGKTAHLLELADLELLALDSDPQRLRRVDETLSRLRLTAHTRAADARDVAGWWDGRPFDAILLDAPCSAAGIVRRHPDVRWLRRDSDIATLAATQAGLLDALWTLLRPGGRLVYATCSVFRAEGEHQIDAFLQRAPDAWLRPSPGHRLPLADNPEQASLAAAGHDGFFYARVDKRAG
ncbi:16S rRNA (cytosine(967)-C(5))-methyltransferase RsmB [Rivibacter subsaxonicus]|uniref:16S rRNA (cytosine(967)-C(5))-methyltransferase n=1 Tax=Rivibacter subsaxonicus TaxID=457575 RepID=A0A4Q7VWA2_9BURK|nr:16S rRNA (cytosine(967)-C(5))-methyltransferase RsmB [Rivibacter subsaxonicus]RZU00599.1 16S rRNA (cytosine967-C5)-methyltransferase [Rivibacter subsaxonicus]